MNFVFMPSVYQYWMSRRICFADLVIKPDSLLTDFITAGGGVTGDKVFLWQYPQELDMINEIFESQWIIGSYPVNKVICRFATFLITFNC